MGSVAVLPPETENRSHEVLEIQWICYVLSLIILVLKIVTRWKITRNLGLDDLAVAFGVVGPQVKNITPLWIGTDRTILSLLPL